MRALAATLVAVLMGLSPASAQTEVPTGSHIRVPKPAEIPDHGALSAVDRARTTAVEFGQCVILADPAGAARATAYFPTGEDGVRALTRLAEPECLRSGELRMPPAAMRGALFVALYRRDRAKVEPSGFADITIDYAQRAPDTEEARQATALRQFADCVVRSDPADSHRSIVSPVGSTAERLAYASLGPHLNACLFEGINIKFSKTVLSGLIAEVLYRLTKAGS